MSQYYTLNEAAGFLTLKLERNFTRGMLIDSAARGEITLCARIEGNLEFSKIDQEAPTELQCFLKTLFKGYIKIPRKAISSNDQFYLFAPAKIVEIVDADLLNTPSAKKILLPNLCGQQVTADGETIPFQINRDDALIPEKDLLFFLEEQKPAESQNEDDDDKGRQNQQENEILRIIRDDLGHDPQKLPPRQPGKPWVKSDVRKILITPRPPHKLFQSGVVFDKAWDRLLNNKKIKAV